MFEIFVADTGVGMATDDIPKALSEFGQVAHGLEQKHNGTGLGLPLSKRLVELHGGEMSISSSPGKGTRVSILLPESRLTDAPQTL